MAPRRGMALLSSVRVHGRRRAAHRGRLGEVGARLPGVSVAVPGSWLWRRAGCAAVRLPHLGHPPWLPRRASRAAVRLARAHCCAATRRAGGRVMAGERSQAGCCRASTRATCRVGPPCASMQARKRRASTHERKHVS